VANGDRPGDRADDEARPDEEALADELVLEGEGGGSAHEVDRRRVIELTLTRRPDIDLEGLQAVLRRLGIEVGVETVVADLDAMGYEVVTPVGSAEADAPPDVFADPAKPADPASYRDPRRAGVPFLGAAPSGEPSTAPREPDSEQTPLGRPIVLIGAAVAIVVALAIAAFVVSRDDDQERAETGGTTTEGNAPADEGGNDQEPATSSEPLRYAPVGPGADEALVDGVDGESGFEVSIDDGVGIAPDGSDWEVLAGTWQATEGEARLVEIEGEEGNGLVVFDPALDAYRAQVRLSSLVDGNGIVFWVEDPDNYWAFVALPTYATFLLFQIVDGERGVKLSSGLTATDAAVAGIHVAGTKVEALVNGAVVVTHELDGEVPDGTALGLGSLPRGSDGRFDDFVYKAD